MGFAGVQTTSLRQDGLHYRTDLQTSQGASAFTAKCTVFLQCCLSTFSCLMTEKAQKSEEAHDDLMALKCGSKP